MLQIWKFYYVFFWKPECLHGNHDPCLACRQRFWRWSFRCDFFYKAINASSHDGLLFVWFFWYVKIQGRCCRNFHRILFESFSKTSLIKLQLSFILFYFVLNVTPEFPPFSFGFGSVQRVGNSGVLHQQHQWPP